MWLENKGHSLHPTPTAVRTGSWTGPPGVKRAPICDALLPTTLNPHPSNKGHWSHPLRTPASHKCRMMGRWTHLGAIFRNDRELLCSSSEVGSYLRLIDFHSTRGLRVMRKKKKSHPSPTTLYPHPSTPALELNTVHPPHGGVCPFLSKVNLPRAINFRALSGANLVT